MWNLDKTTNQPTPVKGQGVVVTHNVKDSYINSDAEKTIAIDLKNILIIFKNGQLLVANKNSTEFIRIKKNYMRVCMCVYVVCVCVRIYRENEYTYWLSYSKCDVSKRWKISVYKRCANLEFLLENVLV